MHVHVRVLVDDFTGCVRFYRDVLGLELVFGDEEGGYADFRAGDGSFALFLRAEMEAAVGDPPELTEGIDRDRVVVVLGVENLEETVETLTLKGANFTTQIVDHPEWGIRTAHLRDPDGNLVELNTPLPGDVPPVDQHGVQGDAG
jgi:catechol 2,3-dioxygenase-like lactoylglutathione lyase family enzyme